MVVSRIRGRFPVRLWIWLSGTLSSRLRPGTCRRRGAVSGDGEPRLQVAGHGVCSGPRVSPRLEDHPANSQRRLESANVRPPSFLSPPTWLFLYRLSAHLMTGVPVFVVILCSGSHNSIGTSPDDGISMVVRALRVVALVAMKV